MKLNRSVSKFVRVSLSILALAVFPPLRAMADEPAELVTPVPGATNLIAPRTPEQATSPIKITKIWKTSVSGNCIDGFTLMGRWVCTQFRQNPFVHWNFENTSQKIATAIRFEVDETSAFGEAEGALISDLTGKFSPNVKIESRANYNRGLHGEGTHWEVRVVKVLWDDGSVWERGAPLAEPSEPPSPSPSVNPTPAEPRMFPATPTSSSALSKPQAVASADTGKDDWQTFTLNL